MDPVIYSTSYTRKPNPLIGRSSPQAVALATNTLQQILEKGNVEELVAALRQLPEGRCDLRDTELTESMVDKLASAVQRVEVKTLLLGHMEKPELLLDVIPCSSVHQWDFSSAWTMRPMRFVVVFPSPHQVRHLVDQVLPRLHRGSFTQQIVLKQNCLTGDAMELLAPFCIDGESLNDYLPNVPLRSVVIRPHSETPTTVASTYTLEHAAPQETSQALARVHPGADHRPTTEQAHAQLLCQLMTAIQNGDADATATLAKALCGCSRVQFDRYQDVARTLACLSAKAHHAAQEILRLKYPVVMSEPQQPTVPMPHPSAPQGLVESPYRFDLVNGDSEAIRQAFLKASTGCVDLRGVSVAKNAEIKALVTALETTNIDSLALGFVADHITVLKCLPRSHVTKVDLYFLSDYAMQDLRDPKLTDGQFQCILDFLNAVSATRPRRELMLDPNALTDAQRQQLTARFSAVETAVKRDAKTYRNGITFVSQFSPPRHEPSPAAEREPQVPPRHEVSAVVPPRRSPTQADSEGASNFFSILGVLGKYISSGNSTQVKLQLGRADAPFNAQQLKSLKAMAMGFTNNDAENVRQAAQVVLDWQ